MYLTDESFKKIEEKLSSRSWCLFAIKTTFNTYKNQPVLCVMSIDITHKITMFYYELSLKKFTWRKIGKMHMAEEEIEKLFSIKIKIIPHKKSHTLQDIQDIIKNIFIVHNINKRKLKGSLNVTDVKPFSYKYSFVVDLISYEVLQTLTLPDDKVYYSCLVYKNGKRTSLLTLYTIVNKKTNLVVSEKPLIITVTSLKEILKRINKSVQYKALTYFHDKEKDTIIITSTYKWLKNVDTVLNAKTKLEIDIKTKKIKIIDDVYIINDQSFKTMDVWDDSNIQSIFDITLINRGL